MAIEVGNVFEGRVTGVKPFGAFVALPEGRVGMVHISEVSNEFVQDIAAVDSHPKKQGAMSSNFAGILVSFPGSVRGRLFRLPPCMGKTGPPRWGQARWWYLYQRRPPRPRGA